VWWKSFSLYEAHLDYLVLSSPLRNTSAIWRFAISLFSRQGSQSIAEFVIQSTFPHRFLRPDLRYLCPDAVAGFILMLSWYNIFIVVVAHRSCCCTAGKSREKIRWNWSCGGNAKLNAHSSRPGKVQWG